MVSRKREGFKFMPLPWFFSSKDHPVLYHYTSFEAAKAIVENNSIWLSEYKNMNDASEFIYARDKLLKIIANREVYTDLDVRIIISSVISSIYENTGILICSFTTRYDCLSNWRFYGGNGSGCVLGVDSGYLEHDAGVAIRSVIYDDSRVCSLLRSAVSVVQEEWEDNKGDVMGLFNFCRYMVADLFSIKHPAFCDESEIRISRMLVNDGEKFIDVGGNRTNGDKTPVLPVLTRDGVFGPTQYVSLPLSDNNNKYVCSVGFGPTVTDDNYNLNKEFFESKGINVWRSRIPYRS